METYNKEEIKSSLDSIGFASRVSQRVLAKFQDNTEYTLGGLQKVWTENNYSKRWLRALADELAKIPAKQAVVDSNAEYEKHYGEAVEIN